MASISLSFSSSLFPTSLPNSNNNSSSSSSNYITLRAREPNILLIVRCAFAAPARSTAPPPPPPSESRKRHWRQGEYPGIPETAATRGISRKPPIKNVKKKLDRKNKAKAWVNTVTESLSERIQNKQWLQALEVGWVSLSFFLFRIQNNIFTGFVKLVHVYSYFLTGS